MGLWFSHRLDFPTSWIGSPGWTPWGRPGNPSTKPCSNHWKPATMNIEQLGIGRMARFASWTGQWFRLREVVAKWKITMNFWGESWFLYFLYIFIIYFYGPWLHGFQIAMLTKTGGYIVWISQKISTRYPMMPWFSSAVFQSSKAMLTEWLVAYCEHTGSLPETWRAGSGGDIYIYTLWRHAFQVDVWAGKKTYKNQVHV